LDGDDSLDEDSDQSDQEANNFGVNMAGGMRIKELDNDIEFMVFETS